ncbi:PTS transporter subunit EIIC [Mycoplasma mycoides]|uniref:PTS transporter subunit EIIC n=1 Tax=Mycoplasma mycoides TaxID=2102 RepID=UPI0022408984|nr:PTS transporter subunit EIIC [Mycoplasma mycoides]QVJ95679.1 PTS transporter subunit EIIC [Mycoplasma mycoides subsp. capri]
MIKDPKITAKEILQIIKIDNINSYTNCLTRLRLNIKENNIDFEKLKSIPNVLDVINVSSNELQIVLGPGFVNKVAQEFAQLLKVESKKDDAFMSASEVGNIVKQNLRANKNWIQDFFTKFSKIFSPMIIGFIGAGILSGVSGIIQSAYNGTVNLKTAPAIAVSWFNALNLILNIWKNAFIIIVGWRTCEIWGGSGVLGAMTAALFSPVFASNILPMIVITNKDSVNYLGINITNPTTNWLTVGFRPVIKNGEIIFSYPSGNILGALLTATASLWIEKIIRKFTPGVLDTILTPTLTLFLLLIINIFLIIPISGYLYTAVAWFFSNLYTNPFGAFILSAIFLLSVSFGVHQGFVPIYAILIEKTGVNGLFPILAMAGMAQVGTGIALWFLANKKSLLRRQIQGAIIPAIFGIGEPMIYGITLPRIRPFVTASIAAGFGGFFLGSIYLWGNVHFGLNSMFGPSGILATFMMTTQDKNIGLGVCIYLLGCLVSIIFGILITLFGYSKISRIGTEKMKSIYKKGQYKLSLKIFLTLAFITIIGIFIYWITSYYKLPKQERIKLANIKVE